MHTLHNIYTIYYLLNSKSIPPFAFFRIIRLMLNKKEQKQAKISLKHTKHHPEIKTTLKIKHITVRTGKTPHKSYTKNVIFNLQFSIFNPLCVVVCVGRHKSKATTSERENPHPPNRVGAFIFTTSFSLFFPNTCSKKCHTN